MIVDAKTSREVILIVEAKIPMLTSTEKTTILSILSTSL